MRSVHVRQFNRLLIATFVGLVGCAVVAPLIVRWARDSGFDPNEARLSLKMASDEQLTELLPRLVSRDDAAQIEFLAGLIGDERPALRLAARETLASRFERWGTLPPQQATPLVAQLARQLAAMGDSLPDDSRPYAADLATRLMLWPVPADSPLDDQIVADCQQALRAIGPTDAKSAESSGKGSADRSRGAGPP
ncbi:MAG TPA: hypothetical protein PLV92_13915, partial [Pirellulaceae bacterium]|nr:hypothetical protein [Pirellulaceae bacterium]